MMQRITQDKRGCTVDKWELYELLKGNRTVDAETIQAVEEMKLVEIREGVLEYLLLMKQNKSPP